MGLVPGRKIRGRRAVVPGRGDALVPARDTARDQTSVAGLPHGGARAGTASPGSYHEPGPELKL